MSEKNGNVEKMLNSNYLNVQKSQLETENQANVLFEKFSKNNTSNSKKLTTEQKEVKVQSKEIKAKYKVNLDSINTDYNKHLEDLSKRNKAAEDESTAKIEKAIALKESQDSKLNKAIEKANKDFVKQEENLLKNYEADVLKSNKDKEQINVKAKEDVDDNAKNLQNIKEKHEAKVASLNEKIAEKINKLTEVSNKKIVKVNEDIAKEEVKTAKNIEDLKPGFDKKLVDAEERIGEEKGVFNTKNEAIKSTLESKVARHEKFMNKNIKDNDQRAAKQHKKEIAILQKSGERELKILTNEHNEKFKVVDSRKRVLVQENLEAIATLSKKLIQYREEKLYQIESYKVILNSDAEVLKLNTSSQVQDEINKYNENERDHHIKVAGIVLKQEIDLEQEDDVQAKLHITFDKENGVNKVQQDEALEIKAKELKLVDAQKDLTEKIANLNKSLELVKLENETKVAEKKLVLDIKVNEEDEIIEGHNLDFINQSLISQENLEFQTEVKSLFEAREEAILSYEELEITNRTELKISFLEAQKARIEADKEIMIAKINSAFEVEQVLYDTEREKASSKDLEELKIYEEEANNEIKKITDKRNALDPKAYKKEIRDLDQEITDSRDELNAYVHTKRESITSNTVLFDKGISEVNARREKSIEESNLFFSQEVGRIENAIDLIGKNKASEINDAKSRRVNTFESTSLLLQNAQLRNNLLIEESTAYKMSRIQNENDVIKDFKDIFEKQKFGFKETLDEKISDLESEIKIEESHNKENISKLEEESEEKINDLNRQLKDVESAEVNSLDKQGSVHKAKYSNIEQQESIKVNNIKGEFSDKENIYRVNISEIDKASSNESKSFETTKKTIKKEYEVSLSKNLGDLISKLQQDIKGM